MEESALRGGLGTIPGKLSAAVAPIGSGRTTDYFKTLASAAPGLLAAVAAYIQTGEGG